MKIDTECFMTADLDVHHKHKNVICALVWHLTKTLNFLSPVHRRRGAPGNPVPRSGTQFIYFLLPSFVPLVSKPLSDL